MREKIYISVIVLLLVLLSYLFLEKNKYDNTLATLIEVDTIRKALNEYYMEKGVYPESIKQLVPKYLKSVNKTPIEYKYIYDKYGKQKKGYISLYFRYLPSSNAEYYVEYNSDFKYWVVHEIP